MPSTCERAQKFWAQRLSCPESLLREPGFHAIAHPSPEAILVVSTGDSVVVAAPPEYQGQLESLAAGSLVQREVLQALVPSGTRLVGPAFIGYATSFPAPSDELRRYPDTNSAEFAALEAALSAEEWEHANLPAKHAPLFACVEAEQIAAAAGAENLLDQVAHIGVVTYPAHRGRGLARRVVSAVASSAASAGLLPQYQTLQSNHASMAVGAALGFERFATTLSARWGEALR